MISNSRVSSAIQRGRSSRADQDVGDRRLGDAVVELGHRARADHFAEAPEGAALLGNRHREQGLALFADLGALGDERRRSKFMLAPRVMAT